VSNFDQNLFYFLDSTSYDLGERKKVKILQKLKKIYSPFPAKKLPFLNIKKFLLNIK